MAQHDVWSWRRSNFFFNKKIKIERPEHLLHPHPLRPITSHFCLTHLPTQPQLPQVERHICCITP